MSPTSLQVAGFAMAAACGIVLARRVWNNTRLQEKAAGFATRQIRSSHPSKTGKARGSFWQEIVHTAPQPSNQSEVSVVSLNFLLKSFSTKPYYPNVPAEHRNWEHRQNLLHQALADFDADVICFQEAEVIPFETDFGEYMRGLGYGAVAPWEKKPTEGIPRCGVFWKEGVFELVATKHASRVLMVVLRHCHTGKLVYLGNVHLEGHPDAVDKRMTQLCNLLQRIIAHQKQAKVDPSFAAVVITGDFNADDDSCVLDLLRRGSVEAGVMERGVQATKSRFAHPFAFEDLYGNMVQRPVTWSAERSTASPDFFFFTGKALRPKWRYPALSEKMVESLHHMELPNAEWPTDHFPIGGQFSLH